MKQNEQGKRSIMAMGLLGVFIAAFGASRNLTISILFVCLAGAALMVVFALNASVVQLRVEDMMRGRVMSVYNVAFRGGMPFGSVLCGYLIKQSSAPAIMVGNGILVVALAFYFLLFQRKVMEM
jgi:predicted MFS family arabinose efflux permease